MKKNEKTMSLAAKLIVGAAFLGLFVLNVFTFVEKDGSGLSLESLKAYAQSGGSGSESEVNFGAESVGTTSFASTRPCSYIYKDCKNRDRWGNNGTEQTLVTTTFCIGQGQVSCAPGTVETATSSCVAGTYNPWNPCD